VAGIAGVRIVPHDLTPVVDPRRIGGCGVRDLERGGGRPVLHETVGDEVAALTVPDNRPVFVDPLRIGPEHAVGDVELGEGRAVLHETVGVRVIVEIVPDDLALVVDPKGIGGCGVGDDELGCSPPASSFGRGLARGVQAVSAAMGGLRAMVRLQGKAGTAVEPLPTRTVGGGRSLSVRPVRGRPDQTPTRAYNLPLRIIIPVIFSLVK